LIDFAKERYPEQFARFEGENPGLPADMQQLAALPNAPVSAGRDPVWPSLAAALVVVGLTTLFTVKVLVPRLQHPDSTAYASTFPTPPDAGTSPSPATAVQLRQSDPPATVAPSQPYTSAEGRFSVMFPGSPTQNAQQVNLTASDSITIHQFEFDNNNLSYLVMYNDYPSKFVPDLPQPMLESVRDRSVASLKATLASDGPIDLSGVPGRAFSFTDKDGTTYVARDFLDGQRLYQVLVTVGPGASTTQAEDFLNSFRIL
jgi:hypothetical protein